MQSKERESWLPGMLAKDGDADRELSSLLATAALLRGAVQAIPVPEEAEAESRERCASLIQEMWQREQRRQDVRRPWPSLVGGWLRVVFTLGRRR